MSAGDVWVYRDGATGLLAEFSVKKYTSHRGITATDLTESRNTKKIHDTKYFQKGKALAQ